MHCEFFLCSFLQCSRYRCILVLLFQRNAYSWTLLDDARSSGYCMWFANIVSSSVCLVVAISTCGDQGEGLDRIRLAHDRNWCASSCERANVPSSFIKDVKFLDCLNDRLPSQRLLRRLIIIIIIIIIIIAFLLYFVYMCVSFLLYLCSLCNWPLGC
jgi:hypothetical protein